MNWQFLNTGTNTGKFNMQFDIELSRICGKNEVFFRLYRWSPYAISLGANQSESDVNLLKAERAGIDVVKRPTGGRAILHAEEITYSLIYPTNSGIGAHELYSKISKAIVRGLVNYDSALDKVYLEPEQPNFLEELNKDTGSICFATSAKNEIKFDGKKLVGSAQRKLNNSILQHGSILVGDYHRSLAKYLNSDVHEKVFENKTIEIQNILNRDVDYDKLADSLIAGFEEEWNIKFSDTGNEFNPHFEKIFTTF